MYKKAVALFIGLLSTRPPYRASEGEQTCQLNRNSPRLLVVHTKCLNCVAARVLRGMRGDLVQPREIVSDVPGQDRRDAAVARRHDEHQPTGLLAGQDTSLHRRRLGQDTSLQSCSLWDMFDVCCDLWADNQL